MVDISKSFEGATLSGLVADAIKSEARNAVPTNVRTFAEVFAGRDRTLVNSDFKPNELAFVRQLIKEANGGPVSSYDHYMNIEPDGYYKNGNPARTSSLSDIVATTLGQFNVSPVQGGYRVTDDYNFNPQYGATREESQKIFWDSVLKKIGKGKIDWSPTDPFEIVRVFSEAYGPRGGEDRGLPVDLFIPD